MLAPAKVSCKMTKDRSCLLTAVVKRRQMYSVIAAVHTTRTYCINATEWFTGDVIGVKLVVGDVEEAAVLM